MATPKEISNVRKVRWPLIEMLDARGIVADVADNERLQVFHRLGHRARPAPSTA